MTKTRYLLLTCCALAGLGLAACETFEGAGRDLESAGESVQDAARDGKQDGTQPQQPRYHRGAHE